MRTKILLAVVACAALLPGCGDLLEPAAAVVDGDKITAESVDGAVEEYTSTAEFRNVAAQGGDPDAAKRQFEQAYLSQLIRRSVLQPVAQERGVEVTDQEVDGRIEEIQGDFPSQSAFEEALKEQGLNLDQLTIIVRDQILESEVRDVIVGDLEPSDDELEDYYRDNLADYRVTEAQHILVSDRAAAGRIADQLRNAPPAQVDELFERLARQESEDTSNARDGGRLQPFGSGELVPEFESAAAELDIGEISEPVRTQFGFHVIRVLDRRERPFEEVREDIAFQLSGAAQEEAWEEWLRERYAEAEVKVNPRYGEFDTTSFQVVDANADQIPGAEVPAEEPAGTEAGD